MGRPQFRTVEELLDGISHRELVEWQEWFRLQPWGEERADLRSAIVASTVANVFGGKRNGGSFQVRDFMPHFGDERKPMSLELQQGLAMAQVIVSGGTIEMTPEQEAQQQKELEAEQQRLTDWFEAEQARWRRDNGKG